VAPSFSVLGLDGELWRGMVPAGGHDLARRDAAIRVHVANGALCGMLVTVDEPMAVLALGEAAKVENMPFGPKDWACRWV
jgi:hypothetical protein